MKRAFPAVLVGAAVLFFWQFLSWAVFMWHAREYKPFTDEAAVLHRKVGEVSELIAVVASKSGLDAREIQRALGTRVPGYMIPGSVHVVEHLPKNANGKTDRAALTRRFGGQAPVA